MTPSLTIRTVFGAGIKPHVPDIARLRISVFREFPYLYDGTETYERTYLKTYTQSPASIAVLVVHDDELVGVSTGLPMADEETSFQQPFKDEGYSVDNIFYFGESILLPEYRGRGIYSHFFEEREQQAIRLGGFKYTCFCAVQRNFSHPLRPDGYQPLDPVWKKFGYTRHPELTTTYTWKDINEPSESEKTMVFWMKQIRE